MIKRELMKTDESIELSSIKIIKELLDFIYENKPDLRSFYKNS